MLHRISALKFERRAKYSDFAILYRGNHQARVFETACRVQGVPYDISGGQSLFDKTEVKDIVAYLRLIANDDDDPAFLRAVTAPKRGIGQTTLSRLSGIATARGESLFAAVFAPELPDRIPARQFETLQEFCALINGLRGRAEREPAGRLLDELLAATRYEAWLVDTLDKRDAEARTKSVRDLTDWLGRKGEADERNLLELTQMIALITMLEGRDGEGPEAIRLSTLHAAKGLEFPHVSSSGWRRASCRTANASKRATSTRSGGSCMSASPARSRACTCLGAARASARASVRRASRRASSASWRSRTCAMPMRRCRPTKRRRKRRPAPSA